MSRMLPAVAAVTFLVLSGCEGADPVLTTLDGGMDSRTDGRSGDVALADTVPPDSGETDGTVWPDGTVPGDKLVPDAIQMLPCLSAKDCESGYCVPGPDGKVCTIPCVEECPTGWLCKPLASQPDQVAICVFPHLDLCRPCKGHEDCAPGEWESNDLCVPYGPQGSFCGVECGPSEPCPADYECKSVEVGGGQMMDQCVRKEGECGCTQAFIAEEAATGCSLTNDSGTCLGERVCAEGGLTACDAATAQAESCNGGDDDCDGELDEGTGGEACERSNEFGTCKGSYACVAGQLACDAIEPAEDVCDGMDNDCDGTADLGFPDKDLDGKANCIDQDDDGDTVLDEEDNCPLNDNPGQENFDLDSLGDACDPDDDNDMTPDEGDCGPLDPAIKPGGDETCDQQDNDCDGEVDENGVCGTGPCAGKKDGTACSDGDSCTVLDECQDGVCGGSPKDCSFLDGSCSMGVCEMGACQQVLLEGNCDDQDSCTKADSCLNGVCLGTPLDCSQFDGSCSYGVCQAGACVAKNLFGACNDGDPCTLTDLCKDGVCTGTPKDCSWMDGACTQGVCANGACSQKLLDGLPCTVQGGCAGTCQTGQCVVNQAGELCNGVDDNCDGVIDEGFPLKGGACDTEDSDLCAFGVWTCKPDGSGLACPSEIFANLVETCNAQDDDCDGIVDDGTLCPAGQMCSNGSCVPECQPVNGGWTDWSCGACSVQCGDGTKLCTRSCGNPTPSCGGNTCVGETISSQSCSGSCGFGMMCSAGVCVDDPCKPDPCNNHGWCVPATGACICDPGYTGSGCSSCLSPWYWSPPDGLCRPANSIDGTANGETVTGSAAADFIRGLAGNDTVQGMEDNDFVNGNQGNDQVNGNMGRDEARGGSEDDIVYGGAEDDFVSGDLGNDTVSGDLGNDRMVGGSGDDLVQGGKGNDYYMIDGLGNDTFDDSEGNDAARCMDGVTAVSDTMVGPNRVLVLTTGGKVTILNNSVESVYGCK